VSRTRDVIYHTCLTERSDLKFVTRRNSVAFPLPILEHELARTASPFPVLSLPNDLFFERRRKQSGHSRKKIGRGTAGTNSFVRSLKLNSSVSTRHTFLSRLVGESLIIRVLSRTKDGIEIASLTFQELIFVM